MSESAPQIPEQGQEQALEPVRRVAALARLELSERDAAAVAPQLARILAAFQSLREVDVEGVEPMTSPIEVRDVLRDDRSRVFDSREGLLANAPERDGDFFSVPKTVGGGS
jgi:aspartyl-tRNA(Asn)/glutamyl-tRNA(Gln) amidotransferase subunit C